MISDRQRICLSCSEKRCCSYYTVSVTARDALRICRALQAAPADFLTYYVADPPGEGFLLAPGGPPCTLALRRRELPDGHASPCIFLLRTNDGHATCGLGELRPAQCRSFPTYLAHGFVGIVPRPDGCVRSWSFAEVRLDEDRRDLLQARDEELAQRALFEHWNERVRSGGRERSFDDFCTFLINRIAVAEVAS